MQFFYIDYINGNKKERNIGFLRLEKDGLNVGLRGVPAQCGNSCKVYITNVYGETGLLGEIYIKNGYGMEKLKWSPGMCFEECMRVDIPLYGNRKGVCILRDKVPDKPIVHVCDDEKTYDAIPTQNSGICDIQDSKDYCQEIYEEIHEDKWEHLLTLYPQVHICQDAQSILIRPKDVVILTGKYHELATNSFVLHSYYNYRQLLLFRYPCKKNNTPVENIRCAERQDEEKLSQYYLGVPGVYYEREQRVAEMFGFEGFENGEARMQQDGDKKLYKGCFGYYMKKVEI